MTPIKNILVPLDGSRLAEAALPAAEHLAALFGATITFIHVIEHKAPQEIHGERHLTTPGDAEKYLNDISSTISEKGITVALHVHENEVDDVARSIVDHSEEYHPDLIVLCSHGWGGIRDVLVGNIAQQVIAHGTTPVLLIHPREDGPNTFQCSNILIPLDTKPQHSQALKFAREMAHACNAAITLMMVIPTLGTLSGQQAATGRLLPGTMSALLDINMQEAEVFLENHEKSFVDLGIPISSRVLRGDPVPTIVDFAKQIQADLIILGTHGKSGTGVFWAGSVAPKVSTNTTIPLLFIPVQKE